MRGGIVAVDAAPEHGHGHPAGLQRSAVRLGVDSAREAADDDETRLCEVPGERSSSGGAVPGARACADDGDGGPSEEIELSTAAHEQPCRRVVDGAEQRWECRRRAGEEAKPRGGQSLLVRVAIERAHVRRPARTERGPDQMRARLSREDRESELAHVASSWGER